MTSRDPVPPENRPSVINAHSHQLLPTTRTVGVTSRACQAAFRAFVTNNHRVASLHLSYDRFHRFLFTFKIRAVPLKTSLLSGLRR
jgi:hypothetical protein